MSDVLCPQKNVMAFVRVKDAINLSRKPLTVSVPMTLLLTNKIDLLEREVYTSLRHFGPIVEIRRNNNAYSVTYLMTTSAVNAITLGGVLCYASGLHVMLPIFPCDSFLTTINKSTTPHKVDQRIQKEPNKVSPPRVPSRLAIFRQTP